MEKEHINGTNLARVAGALGIIVFHFACYVTPLKSYLYETANCPYGQIWVALFFALSGACIARSNSETDIWSFYKKRWKSIFPMFYIAYLLIFVLKLMIWGNWWGAISPWTIPLTLIGMDSYFYYIQPNFSCVGEWFIGALLVCYLLFPLLRQALQYIPYMTLAVLVAGSFFVPYLSFFAVEPWHNLWVCVTIFYLGMLIAQFPAIFTSKIGFVVSAVLTILLFVVPLPLKQYAAVSGIWYPILSGLACCVLLVHIGAYLERPEKIKKLLTYLGNISYPIFLIQHIVISALLEKWVTPTLPVAIKVLCMDIIITLFLADIIWTIRNKFYEKSQCHNA